MNELLNNLIKKYTQNTFMVYCNDVVSDLEELKASLNSFKCDWDQDDIEEILSNFNMEYLQAHDDDLVRIMNNHSGKLLYLFENSFNPEMVEIPEYIEEWILLCKGLGHRLSYAMTTKLNDTAHETLAKKVKVWLSKGENENIFAIAWTTGNYRVAKEQLYQIPILVTDSDRKLLVKVAGKFDIEWQSENEGYWQEAFAMDDIPEKYRSFAEKVEEEDE